MQDGPVSDWLPGVSRDVLRARAALLAQLRTFFAERDVCEVDTPVLGAFGVTDPHIECLMVEPPGQPPRFLQSSPEFAMKRWLAAGSGDIYQLGKVFRAGEEGGRHNTEFTLLEWYRQGFSLGELMDEVRQLVTDVLGTRASVTHSYRDLFRDVLGLDPFVASTDDLAQCAKSHVDLATSSLDRDDWLDLLMSHCVEPALRSEGMVFVRDYPPTQAALARCSGEGRDSVAERFELYVDGVEIANGYHELCDPAELRRRADADNARRRESGRAHRELDERLVAAMEAGLPDCSGVALGVDRLLMLQRGAQHIAQVLPFAGHRA